MLPSSSELHYFLEIAATLNMSRAAERIGISQPALTLAVQRLEESFGQPVLLRSKTGVRLTRAGERLAIHARLLISEWEKIRTDASKDEEEIGGRYSIGCHPSVALYTLPHFLPSLMRDNPRLDINIVHNLSRKITEDVISFKVDFGIVVNPVPHPELIIKPLFNDEVCLWVGSGKVNKSVLIYEPDLIQSQDLLRQMAKKKLVFNRTITSSNLEVISSLVAVGTGVGILPTNVAKKFREFNLKPFESQFSFEDRVCMIFRADVQKSKASRYLAQKITTALGSVHG